MKHSSSLALAAFAAGLILSPALAAEPFGKRVRPSNGAEVTSIVAAASCAARSPARGRAAPRSALSLSAARSNPAPTNGRATCSIQTTERPIRA